MTGELGQTNDPRALVPGDVSSVRARVASWRSIGRALAAVRNDVGSLSAEDAWSGPAAEAFAQKAAEWTPGWTSAADAYLTAAAHLDRYAAELDYAQGKAADAIALYERGVAESAAFRAQGAGRGPGLLGRTNLPGTWPRVTAPLSALVDPGAPARAAAEEMLSSARRDLAAAGDEAARALNGGMDWGRIFSFALAVQAEIALDALRTTGNVAASFGQAFLDHPELLIEVIGGALMIRAGVAGQASGIALDATGVGAAGGVPLNIASTGLIAGGATLAGAGVLQAASYAASSSRAEPFKNNQNRGPDGKYTGVDEQAKIKEQETLDAIEDEIGKPVERQQVRAQVDGGRPTGRYYDGLIKNEDGTYTAIEVKSGTSRYKRTDQEAFDNLVSADNPATARLNGEDIRITQVKMRSVP